MAVAYGCEKFNHFVYGRPVILETDHHPLIAISQKAIGAMPPRLQRFFLRLLRYDIKLQFTPGKQLLLADMLSRATTMTSAENDVTNDDTEVHAVSVVSSLVTENTWKRLATETSRDDDLKQVIEDLEGGNKLKGQWKSFESELSYVKGVLLKACKVVIPANMRKETLERIHQGHLGINKCKARARNLVFWPGINADIEAFAQACSACKKYAYRQPQEPLMLRPVPDKPWYRVGIDIFEYAGRSYLCVYDALSNFPEVELLKDTTAKTVIEATSAIFARYGIPVEVSSDNGPQFCCRAFAEFAQTYGFNHIISSPRYPQSNGLAEKGVQIVKRILKKSTEMKQDFWLGLLAYRSTPMESGPSPGEVLQGRRLRTTLPDVRPCPSSSVQKHRQTDHSIRQLPPLNPGDTVRIKKGAWAMKGQVVQASGYPRSYNVVTEDGRIVRRNRRHLLPTKEAFRQRSRYEPDEVLNQETPQGSTLASSSSDPAISPAPTNSIPASFNVPAGVLQHQELVPRRSNRERRPPHRLAYDRNFVQVS